MLTESAVAAKSFNRSRSTKTQLLTPFHALSSYGFGKLKNYL